MPTNDAAPPHGVTVTVHSVAGNEVHRIPLVWDEVSWDASLESQNFWPDLEKCVEIYFRSNPGMQSYRQAREHPVPFTCTDAFWKSVQDYCDPTMRRLLIKAIAKKVYGILDSKLNDEPIGDLRRFRVTLFWRVHYRQCGDNIVLEEFGPHDIGL